MSRKLYLYGAPARRFPEAMVELRFRVAIWRIGWALSGCERAPIQSETSLCSSIQRKVSILS